MRNFGQYGATDINTGEEFSFWWAPISWTAQKAGEWWYGPSEGGADAGVVGGTITTPAGTVSAAEVYDMQQGNQPGTTQSYPSVSDSPDSDSGDSPKKKPEIPWWLYGGVLAGVAVFGFGIVRYTQKSRRS